MGNKFSGRRFGDLKCDRPTLLTSGIGIGTNMLPPGTHLLVKGARGLDLSMRTMLLNTMILLPDIAVHMIRYRRLAITIVDNPSRLDLPKDGKTNVTSKLLNGEEIDPVTRAVQELPTDSAVVLAAHHMLKVDGNKASLIQCPDELTTAVNDSVSAVISSRDSFNADASVSQFLERACIVESPSAQTEQLLPAGTPLLLRKLGKKLVLQQMLAASSSFAQVPPDTELKVFLTD